MSRDDAALDADFVASVKQHGLTNPIVAVRTADGVVRVRAGQRRTLAARECGLATIPVYVRRVTDGEGDEKAQAVERVAEQIVENDQRQALADAQRVRGIQQLLDAGGARHQGRQDDPAQRLRDMGADALGRSRPASPWSVHLGTTVESLLAEESAPPSCCPLITLMSTCAAHPPRFDLADRTEPSLNRGA